MAIPRRCFSTGIWIELKEESPDKDAVINMDLDDLYEVIESSADMYDDYHILLDNIRAEGER